MDASVARCILIVLALGASLSGGAQDWDLADRATTRLPPAAFVDLPAAIRSELDRRGCTVPQPFTAKRPATAIKGRFTSANQTDWAILCSRHHVSSIIVFRGAAVSAAVEIATEPDINALQTLDGKGAVGYSREIAVVGSRYIQEGYRAHGGPKPPPLDHDGIN